MKRFGSEEKKRFQEEFAKLKKNKTTPIRTQISNVTQTISNLATSSVSNYKKFLLF
jgi:hypothetical protein